MNKKSSNFGNGLIKKRLQREKKLIEQYFMGRSGYLENFEKLMKKPPQERKVWSIYGMGAIGKSWLLLRLEEEAKDNGFLTSYIDLNSRNCQTPDFFFLTLWRCLSEANPSLLINTNNAVARYLKIHEERTDTREIPGIRAAWELPIALLKDIPFIRKIIEQLEMWSEQAKNNFIAKFPVIMMDSLLDDISPDANGAEVEIALFLDTYERCTPTVSEYVKALLHRFQKSALIVIAGRESLLEKELPENEGWNEIIDEEKDEELPDLKKEEIRDWLKPGAKASDEEDLQARHINEITLGFPFLVTFVLETVGRELSKDITVSKVDKQKIKEGKEKYLKERIIKVMEKLDKETADIIKVAAFPRIFNGTLISTLYAEIEDKISPLEASKRFDKIIGYSFIRQKGDWFQCHEILQDIIRDYWYNNNRSGWKTLHQTSMDYFNQLNIFSAFLEETFHAYQLKPIESVRKFLVNYNRISMIKNLLLVSDILLEDLSSYCAKVKTEIPSNDLGEILDRVDKLLKDYPRGDRSTICFRRIKLLEHAIYVSRDLELLARLKNSLGIAWCELPTGNRLNNLQKALEYYNDALRYYSVDKHPIEWAEVQMNLGNAWKNMPTEKRSINITRAIKFYNKAMKVFSLKESPEAWAMTHHNLGEALRHLPTGNRKENLYRAIRHFNDALIVRTKQEYPTKWAMTMINLGDTWAELPEEDKYHNLLKAKDCYEASLEIYTLEEFPIDWAKIQNNLGVTWMKMPAWNRSENIYKAIDYYNDALKVRTYESHPFDWASTKNNLGEAWRMLLDGNRTENLEKASESYRESLAVRTPDRFPIYFAETKHNLALVFLDKDFPLHEEERLEIALGHLDEACSVFSEDDQIHKSTFELRDQVKNRLQEIRDKGT